MKPVAALLAPLILLLPGCFIIDLALNIIDAVLDILFFWAAPGPPGTDAVPAATPMTLEAALAQATAEGAVGPPRLVPAAEVARFDPGMPPFPGAVLRAIPISPSASE